MKNQLRIRVNLATYPSRNRKLFTFCLLFLGVLFLFLSVAGGVVYFSYKNKAEIVKSSFLELEQSTTEIKSEARENRLRVEKAEEAYRETVDVINGLILRKSFSWIDFLACLEASLPDSSYIVSLAPALTENLQMKVRFAVVSQKLEDLLELINNLKRMKFKDLKVLNEAKNDQGFLRSEISLTYERNI